MGNHVDARELGNYLYQMRVMHEYSLQEASERMQINKSTLCRYEQGMIRHMSDKVKTALCEVYGISVRELETAGKNTETAEPIKDGSSNPGSALISDEEFLMRYRKLTLRDQRRILHMVLGCC